MKIKHKKGDLMYIPSAYYISSGSKDVVGGLATISNIKILVCRVHFFSSQSICKTSISTLTTVVTVP